MSEEEAKKKVEDSEPKQEQDAKKAEESKKKEEKNEKKETKETPEDKKTTTPAAHKNDEDEDDEVVGSGEKDQYGFYKKTGSYTRMNGELIHTEITSAMTKKAEEEWKRAKEEYQTRGTLRNARKLATTIGIPMSYRCWAWQLLSGAIDLKAEHTKGLFQTLSRDEPDPDNPVHTQILLDLPRTFPTHSYTASKEGKKEMFRVLSACAELDPSVSYCQGMAFLVAVLLMVMPAEEAFWTMVAMLKLKGLDDFFRPGMPGIVRECLRFEKLLALSNKKMDDHLRANGVPPVLYLVPWFLPMFTNLHDWTTIFRIWDAFMADGISALHRVALAVITTISGSIFGRDMNDFLNGLINPVFPEGNNTFVFMKRVNTIAPDSLFTKANHALRSEEEYKSVTPKKTPTKRMHPSTDDSSVPAKKTKAEKGGFTSLLKRAFTPTRKSAAKTATPAKSSLVVEQPPATPSHLPHPMVSPSKQGPATTPTNNVERTPPRLSPTAQEAFKEFSTPSPIVSFRGRRYQMTPTSPIHPMMMELCTVSTVSDRLDDEKDPESKKDD